MAIDCKAIETEMAPALDALGLFCLGWFVMTELPFSGCKAVLIGNHAVGGSHKMWEVFAGSPEYQDGQGDPLDRWTQRVVGEIARSQEAAALYPFGEKLWPFQRYAKQASGMKASPLGIFIHSEFGLWQAFRAVLVFSRPVELNIPQTLIHPCDNCLEKPCLTACPVDAFSGTGFEVTACRTHLASAKTPDCMALGCRARAACPVGMPYSDAQIRFHMKAFGKAGKSL